MPEFVLLVRHYTQYAMVEDDRKVLGKELQARFFTTALRADHLEKLLSTMMAVKKTDEHSLAAKLQAMDLPAKSLDILWKESREMMETARQRRERAARKLKKKIEAVEGDGDIMQQLGFETGKKRAQSHKDEGAISLCLFKRKFVEHTKLQLEPESLNRPECLNLFAEALDAIKGDGSGWLPDAIFLDEEF